MKKRMHSGLRLAIEKAGQLSGCDYRHYRTGGKKYLAEALGITVQSLNQWKRIPKSRIMMVHRLTGIPLERLEPDLFKASKPH